MAALPPDHVFVYPDPSLLGLQLTPPQSSPQQFFPSEAVHFSGPNAPVAPVLAAPAPPFPLDPALLAHPGQATALAITPSPPSAPAPVPIVAAPVPPPPPIAGPVLAPPLSAAGLQPFPALTPGLQAPIELTNAAQIALWDKNLRVSCDYSGMGLRNGRPDTCRRSAADRRSRARKNLKILWEAAGGAPYTGGKVQ